MSGGASPRGDGVAAALDDIRNNKDYVQLRPRNLSMKMNEVAAEEEAVTKKMLEDNIMRDLINTKVNIPDESTARNLESLERHIQLAEGVLPRDLLQTAKFVLDSRRKEFSRKKKSLEIVQAKERSRQTRRRLAKKKSAVKKVQSEVRRRQARKKRQAKKESAIKTIQAAARRRQAKKIKNNKLWTLKKIKDKVRRDKYIKSVIQKPDGSGATHVVGGGVVII